MYAKNIKNKNKDGNKTNKNKEQREITIVTLLRYYNLTIKIQKKIQEIN